MKSREAWQEIRTRRANPPRLVATDDERRRVFSAALEQAEQLATAASQIGVAAKPIPLFYALSQAGRALGAALLEPDWMLSGHGLRFAVDRDDLLASQLIRQPARAPRVDSFGGVAQAVGSPTFTTAPLGACLAALPELWFFIGAFTRWSPTLRLRKIEHQVTKPSTDDPDYHRELEIVGLSAFHAHEDKWRALRACPALDRATFVGRLPGDAAPHALPEGGGPIVLYIVDGSPGEHRVTWSPTSQEEAKETERLLEALPIDEEGNKLATPRIGDGDPLNPIMLWWSVLLGLSSVARYEPALWLRTLDVDSSPLAVPLERFMALAEDAIPTYIGRALRHAW